MGSDSFERGGRPHSVPDQDGEAYDAMIRRHRVLLAARENDHAIHASQAPGAASQAHAPHGVIDSITAGVVHVLNGPRAARREVEQGHLVRGILDGAAAAADLQLARGVFGGLRRGSFKLSGSHTHGATRKWLGRKGLASKGQHAHHGLIPNGGWGKVVPAAIKNQPWNYKMTETPLHHVRIHSRSLKAGLPRFNRVERYLHGTPTWWKAANASLISHGAAPLGHALSEASHFIGDHLPGHYSHSHGGAAAGSASKK